MKQLKLNIYKGKHGGRRPNSGRKRLHSRGISHRKRELIKKTTPLHINFKIQKGLPGLRNKVVLKLLKEAVLKARMKGLNITHFSLQSNHVHLMIESTHNKQLTLGMRSLLISFTKKLNFHWKNHGQVLKERYHLHVLRTLKETKNALNYIVQNHIRHNSFFLADFQSQISQPSTWLLSTANYS